MVATAGDEDSLSVMRFLNDTVVIHTGETAEWTNQDPITPHTITFGIPPANPRPPSANATMDADGARHATITSVFDGVHSGFIIPAGRLRIAASAGWRDALPDYVYEGGSISIYL